MPIIPYRALRSRGTTHGLSGQTRQSNHFCFGKPGSRLCGKDLNSWWFVLAYVSLGLCLKPWRALAVCLGSSGEHTHLKEFARGGPNSTKPDNYWEEWLPKHFWMLFCTDGDFIYHKYICIYINVSFISLIFYWKRFVLQLIAGLELRAYFSRESPCWLKLRP